MSSRDGSSSTPLHGRKRDHEGRDDCRAGTRDIISRSRAPRDVQVVMQRDRSWRRQPAEAADDALRAIRLATASARWRGSATHDLAGLRSAMPETANLRVATCCLPFRDIHPNYERPLFWSVPKNRATPSVTKTWPMPVAAFEAADVIVINTAVGRPGMSTTRALLAGGDAACRRRLRPSYSAGWPRRCRGRPTATDEGAIARRSHCVQRRGRLLHLHDDAAALAGVG